jgi:hypothetical protein
VADISELELDALWEEFHSVVNMTSAELSSWLRVESAAEETEELPEESGSETGRHVLGILQKRRMDLTDDDVRVMREVVDTVNAERGGAPAAKAQDTAWRHRLMQLGHDPLKAG